MSQMYNSLFQFLECPPKHPLFRLQTNKSYLLHFYVTIMQKDAMCAFFIGKLNYMQVQNLRQNWNTKQNLKKKIRKKPPPKHPDN